MHTSPSPFSSPPAMDGPRAATPLAMVLLWLVMAWLLLWSGATPASAQGAVPVSVLGQPVQQLSGGMYHTCAVTAAGAALCWGSNRYGQLGDGSNTQRTTPQPVTGLASGVAAIAAGQHHTCALTTVGAVQCWGQNTYNQLGDGGITDRNTPQTVPGLASGVAAIAAGGHHTCALTTAGAVQCWGRNTSGQLGDGTTANRTAPQPVTNLASGVAAIAAGSGHTCALTTAGAVQCWGSNNSGQLGDGTTAGQLGNGSTTDKTTPQPVTVLASGVAAIDAGLSHTCALTTAGGVQCWGQNWTGQLGDGSTTGKTTPQPIDATLPDGIAFTPLGLLRWVHGGVVVQFAPAVADLAGPASAVTALLPDAQTKLGAEGVLQLRIGGQTYVLKPDWTGAGTAVGTPRIGVDAQGRTVFQIGQGASQLLLPSLLNATLAHAIFQAALPGSALAVQPASNEGAATLTLAGQSWTLVPQGVLLEGAAAQGPAATAPWWMGADGLVYLRLGNQQVQGMRVVD